MILNFNLGNLVVVEFSSLHSPEARSYPSALKANSNRGVRSSERELQQEVVAASLMKLPVQSFGFLGTARLRYMINLGVIGVGPVWASYRSVLPQLRKRAHVTAIYDVNHALAAHAAKELDAVAVTGIQTMARRQDVSAILLADVGWLGTQPINLLSECQKPVFIAPWLPADAACYERWFDANAKRGVTLMPALWRRFMPVAVRLKELFATELGLPHRVRFSIDLSEIPSSPQVSEAVLGWLDFVCYLIPREPAKVCIETSTEGLSPSTTIHIHFPPTNPHPIEGSKNQAGAACHVSVTLQHADQFRRAIGSISEPISTRANESPLSEDWQHPTTLHVPRVTLECLSGEATIANRATLIWESSNIARQTESLDSERSERVVMLDHFFRRAVGGLIPVADFFDLHRALRIATTSH